MKQLYLIHSLDAKWVTRQREVLIDELVTPEMRDENLLEIYPTSSAPLNLAKILPQVLSELATIPFLPDSRRVVVVHDLPDFLAGGTGRRSAGRAASKKKSGEKDAASKKKLTPVEALARFVMQDLAATENALVFSNIVESDRGQYIDDKAPLYRLILESPLGEVIKPPYKEQDPVFLMSAALVRRETAECLKHFRAVYRDDSRTRVFHELLRNVRFLTQAKILLRTESAETNRDVLEMKYMPQDARLNLLKQPAFVQRKIQGAAPAFQFPELIRALERLLDVNRWLYPSQNDPYVADVQLLLETFIVEFCEGNGRRAAARAGG
ncbi:hypothetical protein JW916_09505 [Candidatus Sumerlaeota bacterium]|nr:hypothetical protein [Candidatus Sumerlaeota bacterium]